MGNKYAKPDPLDAARAGDEDALEQVLGGIVAPIFDLALLRFRQPVRAEVAVVEGLRALADAISAGGPTVTPLAAAARVVLAPTDDIPPLVAGASDVEQAIDALPEDQRRAVLGVLVCDLDADELGHALDREPAAAWDLHDAALEQLDQPDGDLRDDLDERAATVSLPFGLIDRALG